MKKPLVAVIAGAVALVSIGAGGVASAMDKAITLSVDGELKQAHVWGATVQDALAASDIALSARDLVSPAAEAPISDGTVIDVRFARPVTVDIDGTVRVFWTTAATLDDALAEFGLHDPDARLSVDRSTPLGREGLAFSAVTPKDVEITLGNTVIATRSTAADVQSLLNENGIAVDSDDRVSHSVDTPVSQGLQVNVQRVEVKEVVEEAVIDYVTQTTEDASMTKGTQTVTTAGKEGTKAVVWQVVYVEGIEESRAVTREDVIVPAVDQQVTVGTKAATVSSATASYSGSHADWMAAAGISPSDYSAVEILVMRESSWNPSAVNPTSGACGLTQALPCSKIGPNWSDPVVALAWGDAYVKGRYGSWQAALAHSYSVGWY